MFVHDRIDPNAAFRERRRRARRMRRLRRALAAAVLLAAAAGLGLGVSTFGRSANRHAAPAARAKAVPRAPSFARLPREVRGIHVTMALASLPGRIDDYLKLASWGMNTLEVDVKDENGQIGFVPAGVPLAKEIGAARPYYSPSALTRKVHARGVYLIGRVVVFEDPVLSAKRPDLAIHTTGGSVWRTSAGLGWTNPYSKAVWRYNVAVAVAAAKAGFDEIQFDYVRFPTDGNASAAVYPGERAEPKGITITDFMRYAVSRLHPLGVRVSADLFGLAATRDLGIGQVPKRLSRVVDAIYPMDYPSHFGAGEYQIQDPSAEPGRTVAHSLLDFRRQIKGGKAALIPWLQDFSLGRAYGLTQVEQQIVAARRQHAHGFMLWNPEGVYTEQALAG